MSHHHHDPNSVMSQYLGCGPEQVDLYHPGTWPRWGPQDWRVTSYPGTWSFFAGRISMLQAPLPVRSAVPRVLRPPFSYHDEEFLVPMTGLMRLDSDCENDYDQEEERERINHWKSITKEETAEERARKEKRARKKERRQERRQERKARDLECKAQQRRARNQFRKGR